MDLSTIMALGLMWNAPVQSALGGSRGAAAVSSSQVAPEPPPPPPSGHVARFPMELGYYMGGKRHVLAFPPLETSSASFRIGTENVVRHALSLGDWRCREYGAAFDAWMARRASERAAFMSSASPEQVIERMKWNRNEAAIDVAIARAGVELRACPE